MSDLDLVGRVVEEGEAKPGAGTGITQVPAL
jgi:hypothetical protein